MCGNNDCPIACAAKQNPRTRPSRRSYVSKTTASTCDDIREDPNPITEIIRDCTYVIILISCSETSNTPITTKMCFDLVWRVTILPVKS